MTSLYDRHGRRLELADAGRRGGEGTVHRIVGDASRVAKLYHPGRLTTELHTKLRVMLDQAPADPQRNGTGGHRSIAWVDGLVYGDTSGRELRGFTMPFVDTDEFRQAHVYYDPSDRVRLFGGDFTWRHLLFASHNLASAVAAVHAAGHRVGDLRETNLLVAPSALVTLIDCDSFQIRDRRTGDVYPTRVATGDYLPPELQSIDFRTNHPDRHHSDLFALAVLVFRFLMLGVHPFQARGDGVTDAPTTEAKIRKGLFAFSGRRRGVEPPEYAPPYGLLPASLRRLFARAFVDGHGNPDARPEAADWVSALASEGRRLRTCRTNENHVFANGVRSCPWCRMSADPFPCRTFIGRQIALPNAPTQVPESARVEQVRAYARVALADGALTDTEIAYLRRAGGELGLRTAVVDRVMDDEARRNGSTNGHHTTPPASAPAPTTSAQRRWLPRPSAAWRVVRDRRARSAVKAAAPVIVLSALGGALAPIVGAVSIACVGVPVLAVIGETRSAHSWRARARLPLGFVASLHQSLGHAARVFVPIAIVGLALTSVPQIRPEWIIRAFGGVAASGVALFAILRLPRTTDRLGTAVSTGLDAAARTLVGDSGRMRRAAYGLWAMCAAAAVALGAGYWLAWPLDIR